MKRRRQYTRDFKIGVIREVESGKTLAQVSRENEIHPSLVVKWKKEYFRDPKMPFMAMATGAYKGQARMVELERLVGQLYTENEFLKKALTRLEGKNKEEEIKEARGGRGEIHAHKRESRIWKPNISKSSYAIVGRKQMRVL